MATRSTSIWQPDRPWLSAGRISLLIALSPILLAGLLVGAAVSVIEVLFPPRPSSAQEMADGLTEVLVASGDLWDLDDALASILSRKYVDPRVQALKLRVKALPEFPWDQAVIDEVTAIRDSARAIAAGDAS